MKLLIQRVSSASVKIDKSIVSSINLGYLVLVSFTYSDNNEVIDKMIDKMIKLRLFDDSSGKINLSIGEVNGSILSVPQFSLYASCKKGNRPSFDNVLSASESINLFNYYKDKLSSLFNNSSFGVFRANMEVNLVNDGPLTIILDSKEIYG